MPTQCNTKPLEFEAHGRRRVVADFDGGPVASRWVESRPWGKTSGGWR